MTHSQTSFVRKHNYRRDIDGLRGLAVALVLAFHAFPSLVHGGFIGVDIFFVISGYLISSILLEELAHDSFTFSSFWGRRIRRIFPALILVLIANLGFGFFALFPFEFKQLGLNALAGASFASNFVSITQASYFDTAADTKPLLHLWSLAIEEQFYIFWPVLLWLSFKVRLNLLVVILFVLGTSFLLNLHEINVSRIVDFYSPQTRVWELLAGALVARFSVNKNHFVRQAIVNFPNLSALLGFTLIIFGVFFLNGHSPFPGVLALLPVVGTCLLIMANQSSWFNRVVLSSKVLVGVGLISYPLYLWHWSILSFLQITTGHSVSTSVLLIALCASFVLAWLTYRLIELPIRNGDHKIIKTYALVGAMITIGYLGYVVYDESGFRSRQRFDSYAIESYTSFGTDVACKTNHPQKSDFCSSSKPGEAEVALLLGDSHAQHLFPGFKEYFDSQQQNLVTIGIGNCQPLLGVDTKLYGSLKNCPDLFDPILTELVSSSSVKTVLLSSYAISAVEGGLDYLSGNDIELTNIGNQAINGQQTYLDGLHRTLNILKASNKDVVLILDTPELKFDPILCIGRPLNLAEKKCNVPREVVDKRLSGLRNAIFEIAKPYPNVRVFDPLKYLCDSKYCYAEMNGRLLYHDKNHLSNAGSQFLAEAYKKFISP